MEFEKVYLNEYGYYELREKPFYEDRKNEFENEYFQNSMSSYEQEYEEEEIKYFTYKLKQKQWIVEKNCHKNGQKSFLDIGCGEGFALDYFDRAGYRVAGIDFSKYGLAKHNPHMMDKVIFGDCYEIVLGLKEEQKRFDIINMDAVLDMVLDPGLLIEYCRDILEEEGILFIKTANNYSKLQLQLLQEGKLDREYWLDENGHPSYFNREGLIRFFESHAFECVDFYGESFIDFNLINDWTNYYQNPETGKACYRAKVELENLLHEASIEKTLQVYKLLGEMGFGREIIGIFKRMK